MAKVEVEMPQMGESVMEGTVIEWAKNVGDQVEEDETLLEIATDKVDTEVPSPQAGTLVEILAEVDETVEVGQAIAVIETDAEVAAETTKEKEEESEEPEPKTDEQEAPEENGSVQEEQEGEKIEIKMPKMGESVMEGTVIEWAKEVGDKVEEDETLLEISTDKVDSEVPSPEAGTLVEQVVQPEETVEVGETIAIIATGKVAEKQQPETGGTETEEKKEVEKQDTE